MGLRMLVTVRKVKEEIIVAGEDVLVVVVL